MAQRTLTEHSKKLAFSQHGDVQVKSSNVLKSDCLSSIFGLMKINAFLYAQSANTDVTFDITNGPRTLRFEAHKSILAKSSEVFQAMFNGPMHDDQRHKKIFSIKLTDIDPIAFNEFLKFIYQKPATIDGSNVLTLLYLSKKYMLNELKDKCYDFLDTSIDADNFCSLIDHTLFRYDKDFEDRLLLFFRENTMSVLTCESFLELPKFVVEKLSGLDKLRASELEMFLACCRWAKSRQEKLKDIRTVEMKTVDDYKLKMSNLPSIREIMGHRMVKNIRFLSMSKNDFLEAMRIVPLLEEKEIQFIRSSTVRKTSFRNMGFTPIPREPFHEYCIDRTSIVMGIDTVRKKGVDEIQFVPNTAVYMKGLAVYKRKNFNKVEIELSLCNNDGSKTVLGSDEGFIRSLIFSPQKLTFKKYVKLDKMKKYEIKTTYKLINVEEGHKSDKEDTLASTEHVIVSKVTDQIIDILPPNSPKCYSTIAHLYYIRI